MIARLGKKLQAVSLIGCWALSIMVSPAWSASSDVRVLIDVSGSMRHNDPHNLRRPALQLVTELLPAGNQAGVWLFADSPEPLVGSAAVDDDWKAQTRKRLGRIHSNGNFTDIESVIDAAIADWTEPPEAGSERHLVLLTDGLVDVPDGDAGEDADAASRSRITDVSIPRLQELGIKVHVVALSDDVDTPVVKALTERTGGWLEVAKNDAELQRAFLRMLEQSAPPTTVPIEGGQFTVDSAVREFTLLAFHPPGKPVSLVTPDGKTITAGRIPIIGTTKVTWKNADEYDLVTITAPDAGDWKLEGSLDPDNRVAVLTDLNIATDPIPNSVPSQANLPIRLWPTEKDQPIKLNDFLSLASARVELTPAESESANAELQPQPETAAGAGKADGPLVGTPALLSVPLPLDPESLTYHAEIAPATLEPGTYRLSAILESATFSRQISRSLRVTGPPIEIAYEPRMPPDGEPGDASLGVQLSYEPDLIRVSSLFGFVKVEGPDGVSTMVELNSPSSSAAHVEVPIAQPGAYRATARVHAQTAAGESLMLELPEKTFEFNFDNGQVEPPPPAEGSVGISWPMLAAVVGGGTAIFAVLIGLVLWLTRTPSATAETPEPKT